MLRNDCPRLHLYAKADASVQLASIGILGTLAGNSGIYLIYIIALYAYSSTIANRDTVLFHYTHIRKIEPFPEDCCYLYRRLSYQRTFAMRVRNN